MGKVHRILVCFVAVLVGGLVCVACNNDGDMSTHAAAAQDKDPSSMTQQGQGGAKARAGGGMAPINPVPAGPGEKTGLPK
jgi:hypothetical protein